MTLVKDNELLKEIQAKWPKGPYSIVEAISGIWTILTPDEEQYAWYADQKAAVDYAVILNTAFILGYANGKEK